MPPTGAEGATHPIRPPEDPKLGKLGATHRGNAARSYSQTPLIRLCRLFGRSNGPRFGHTGLFLHDTVSEAPMVPPTFIEQRNQTLPTQRDGHKEVPPILIQNLGATHRDANSAFGNKTKALCYTDRDASRRKPNVVSAPNYRHGSLLFSTVDHFHCGLVIKSLRRTYLISPPLRCKSQQFRVDSMSNHRLLR